MKGRHKIAASDTETTCKWQIQLSLQTSTPTCNLLGLTFQITHNTARITIIRWQRINIHNKVKQNVKSHSYLKNFQSHLSERGTANKSVTFQGSKFLVPDDRCWMAQLNATDSPIFCFLHFFQFFSSSVFDQFQIMAQLNATHSPTFFSFDRSDLWVELSVTNLRFWYLTDVTLADEDTNSILTDKVNRTIQCNVSMQV